MRALLVLYLTLVLKFGEAYGTGLYADYYGLIELGGVLGALFADRVLGVRRAILLGGLLMGFGHLFLALGHHLLAGFGFVVVGSSLFAPNLLAHLSSKPQKGMVSSVFMIVNAGTYFATPLCLVLTEKGIWSYGFWLASLGALTATLVLYFSKALKAEKSHVSLFRAFMTITGIAVAIGAIALSAEKQTLSLTLLPWFELSVFAGLAWMIWRAGLCTPKQILVLGCTLVGLTLFYAFEESFSSHTSSSLLSLSPLLVFSLEGPLDKICRKIGAPFLKLALPFLVAALSFGLLSLGLSIGGIGCISLGEVLIGSIAYWTCLELAPKAAEKRMQAKIFCLASIIFSLATSWGSQVCKSIAAQGDFSLARAACFLLLIGLLLGAIVHYCLCKKMKRVGTAS